MSAMTSPQANNGGHVLVSVPLLQEGTTKRIAARTDGSMQSVIAVLAGLRERYLAELQAARIQAKKNFLR